MRKVLILLLLSIKGFAQEEPKDVIYRGFYNISFYFQSPIGQFKKAIASDFSKENNSGISFSYLTNPRKKAGELSTILLGGELGISGNKQNSFFLPPPQGDFYMTHRQVWTILKFRYLPNLAKKKVVPYLDGGLGPKFYFSRMMENAGEDEVYKVYGSSAKTISYYLELGSSIKISGQKRPFTYLDFGLGYTQSNSVKIIDRDRVGFTTDYEVIEAKKSVKPKSVYFKVGITSYL
ncbi:hypothetical protein EGI26_04145 [Lacihabitans sp. CCS-44]|uniref:hypothetical protein n=1 Tax=Lacihabitans sp. CCS-44 TaxID=2487331 RepID=UPI0020CF87D3|nr:hypothetical protein [Lacihabitans sp. CCS-44]MCP9754356.1 hypothetical protein [Lacihabitans sp. CCS-44]